MSQTINDETAARHPGLAEYKKCKAQGSWYGLIGVAIGGSLCHMAQNLTQVIKKEQRIPFTLGVAVASGFLVSSTVTYQCSKKLKLSNQSSVAKEKEILVTDPASLVQPDLSLDESNIRSESSYPSRL